jgi:uncharacterized membrane protein YphA (DoxX/SURF4 family)
MKRLDSWYERWLFESYRTDPASLGLYRIVFATLLLADLPLHLWIPRFPDSFFDPPIGMTLFFAGFPRAWFFYVLDAGLVVALSCLLFGLRTRLASLNVALLLFVGNAWSYSFGKINHDILYVLVPLVMAFSSWGDRYSLDARLGRRSNELASAWPVCLLLVLTAAAMGYAGIVKATSGWLDPSTSAVRGHMTAHNFMGASAPAFGTWLLRFDVPALWEAADAATIGLEAGFLLAMFSRRLMRLWCALAAIFHALVFFAFNISPFLCNLLVYAVLIDWSFVLARLVPGPSPKLLAWGERVQARHVFACGLALAVVCLLVGDNPVRPMLDVASGGHGDVIFSATEALVALCVGLGFLLSLVRRPATPLAAGR